MRVALATPRATVLAMSWSFTSRKTRLPACASALASGRAPADRERELIADLVEPHRIAKALDHRLGSADVVEIERHDQAIARLHVLPRHVNGGSALAIDPDARGRQVHPDPLGSLGVHAGERF